MKLEELKKELNDMHLVEYKYPIGFRFWNMRHNKPIEHVITEVYISVAAKKVEYRTDLGLLFDNESPEERFLTKEALIDSLR